MANKGHVLGGGAYVAGGQKAFALAVIDLDDRTPKAELVNLTFLAHGIAFDPNDRFRAAIFEKKGPGACAVDLRSMVVTNEIATLKSRRFYGHGAFSSDGKLLYATESMVDQNYEGVLVVRDGTTFEELGTLPTFGTAPHDCVLVDEGATLVVANGGGPVGRSEPSVTYIDLKTEKLLDRVALPSSKHNAGHLALSQAGDLAIVSAPREGKPHTDRGALTVRTWGGKAITATKPNRVVERMIGETLSVLIREHDRTVFATHPLGDCVTVWKLDDVSLVETLEIKNPRGLATTLDGAWILVSHSTENNVRIAAFDALTRKPVGVHVEPSFMTGSHLFVCDLQLTD